MKKVAILFIVLLTSSLVFAQNTYVPDDKFEQALIDLGYDTTMDDSVVTANISGVTNLDVQNKEIADLTGIEDFVALIELWCAYNLLTSLNVSASTALTILMCNNNQLTSLDVSSNTALIDVNISKNLLTSFDVTNNTALTHLINHNGKLTSLDVTKNIALIRLVNGGGDLSSAGLDISKNTALTSLNLPCNLTSLDVSKNTALITIYAPYNQLTSLDVSKNTALQNLTLHDNQLTSLDVSNNTALIELNVHGNQLTSLDVSSNTNLTYLNCDGNQLTSLDMSKNTALTEIIVENNQLTSLDISSNTSLVHLNCSTNKLTSLDVSNNTALTWIECNTNQLTTLDVSKNTSLYDLSLRDNQLTSLDVSKNTALTKLWVQHGNNQLTNLDVSHNTALDFLALGGNQLTSLDVSKNTALTKLYCRDNLLTSLDVSKNTALTWFHCVGNQLTSLKMRNGVTDSLTIFNATNNPNLTCIETLDPTYATANWTSAKENIDAGVTFTYICGVDVDGISTYNNNGIKAITFNVELPTHSLPDTNISLAFWKSGAESNECTGCNGRDTVSMRKLSDDHWEATVGLDTTLVVGDVGESMYWYHYVKTVSPEPEHELDENSDRFKSTSNPDGLRQLAPGWHKKSPLAMVDTVTAWENIPPKGFGWISEALDTLKISKTSLDDNYTFQWSASTNLDEDPIHYLVYAKVGVYPAEEIYDTTVTTLPISSREFINNVFEQTPGNGVTVRFSVSATDGTDTVKISGDDRVLYVNRYEFLSTETKGMPTEFALHENYPNPFNPSTTLRFDLPELRDVNVIIYNMLGQKVKTFNMENISAGHHSIKWNATNDLGDPVSAGVYLYQLQAKDFVKTRKMILLK